jgi:hypothetical protein
MPRAPAKPGCAPAGGAAALPHAYARCTRPAKSTPTAGTPSAKGPLPGCAAVTTPDASSAMPAGVLPVASHMLSVTRTAAQKMLGRSALAGAATLGGELSSGFAT